MQKQKELEKKEAFLKNAYNLANIGHWELDLINSSLYWSKEVKNLYEVDENYQPDLESAINFFKEGSHRETIRTLVEQAIESGEPYDRELKIITEKGNERWIRVTGEAEFKDGECIRIYGSTQNIHDRKRTENKLKQLSIVASKTTDMIIMTDADGHVTWVNKAFEEQTGYSLEGIKGNHPSKLLQGPETDPEISERLRKGLQNRETVNEVMLLYRKDGSKYWADMTIDPIFNEKDEFSGFISIERDVTEKIKREKKLQRSVKRYDIVSKATSDTIWDFDLKNDCIYYNKNIFHVFGYEKREINKAVAWWRDKLHPDDRSRVVDMFQSALASGETRIQVEYRFRCADGNYKHVYDRAFVLTDEEGDPERIIGAMQDITPFKTKQERARRFQEVISDLATDRTLTEKSLEDALKILVKKSAKTLELDRVNVWLMEDDVLRCISSYDSGEINTIKGTLLIKEDYPKYFKEINNSRSLVSPKVRSDDRLDELKESYLIPNNVYSLLDTSVRTSGETKAVVCHESVGEKKYWQSEEISFAGAITDQIAQLFANKEKKEQEQELRDSLKEKETLLAEVHHRVKNNLAVVSGMMQLQAFEENDESMQHKLYDNIMRIQSMASIHEILYQSGSFSEIELDENIKKLVSKNTETLQKATKLALNYNLEPIELNINQAIPCSLIVNEVITNALKHAFTETDSGSIGINLSEDEGSINLAIIDNGKGLPDDFDNISENSSLGLKLIRTLTQQLNGDYNYESTGEGTAFTLQFKKENIKGIGSAHFSSS